MLGEIIVLLQSHEWLILVGVLLLGLLIGSFLNVVIYRLPLIIEREIVDAASDVLSSTEYPLDDKVLDNLPSMTLSTPRSACPSCGHQIKWYENIPAMSWLMLRGRCSQCKNKISMRYPLIELACGVFPLIVFAWLGLSAEAVALTVAFWFLLTLTMIDIDHQVLPDTLTLGFLWVGLILSVSGFTEVSPAEAIVGGALGWLCFWLLNMVYLVLFKVDALGRGDFKLFAAIGVWTGGLGLLVVAILSGILFVVLTYQLLQFIPEGQDKNQYLPFGPYLALSAMLVMMFDLHGYVGVYLLGI